MSTSRDIEHPLTRSVPEAEFVWRIDRLLRKDNPECTIPWPAHPPPGWTSSFRPRRIVDIGCGEGAFTQSVLTRLAQWGCLADLQEVVLVEKEAAFGEGAETPLVPFLTERTRTTLTRAGAQSARITPYIATVTLGESGANRISTAPDLGEIVKSADLIILSHVTYYFGDGSGLGLVQGLIKYCLTANGLLWCVVRRKACVIYQQRAELLEALKVQDPKPLDYAEDFERVVLPELTGGRLVDVRDQGYLDAGEDATKRYEAAYLLMWREYPEDLSSAFAERVRIACMSVDPLFTERHFILGVGDRGLGLE